jgi:hypothetical protein
VAKGVKHYYQDGREHKGGMHKHPDGKLMTGKTMSSASKSCITTASFPQKPNKKLRAGGDHDYIRKHSIQYALHRHR